MRHFVFMAELPQFLQSLTPLFYFCHKSANKEENKNAWLHSCQFVGNGDCLAYLRRMVLVDGLYINLAFMSHTVP